MSRYHHVQLHRGARNAGEKGWSLQQPMLVNWVSTCGKPELDTPFSLENITQSGQQNSKHEIWCRRTRERELTGPGCPRAQDAHGPRMPTGPGCSSRFLGLSSGADNGIGDEQELIARWKGLPVGREGTFSHLRSDEGLMPTTHEEDLHPLRKIPNNRITN